MTNSKVEKTLGSDISKKRVSIAGLGSVGSLVAESLARMGTNLRIVDMGRVHEEDLVTTSLFKPGEETKFKAKEGKKHLESLNPNAKIKCFHEQLSESNVFLLESDVVIDCTQNWEASLMINNFCKSKKIPLIYSRVAGPQGIVLAHKGGFAHTKLQPLIEKLGNVEEKGLLPSTVHMASSIILTKALKILTEEKYSDKLFHFDSWKLSKKESKL